MASQSTARVPDTPLLRRPSRPEVDWRLVGAVSAITLVGLALRLSSFGDSLFGDELSTYYIVAGHSFGRVMHLLNNHSVELNPPLFFMAAWVSTRLFGLSTESLKLVSLLAGTATIPLIYLLGRHLSRRVGLVASTLAATSPFLIYYSTEARAYSLMAFLVLAATVCLIAALRSGRWGWWALYALCTAAAAYTHFTSIFALAALAGWALVTQPAARRRVLIAVAAAVVLYLPEVPVLRAISRSSGTRIMGELDPLSLHAIRFDVSHWALGHPYLSLTRVPGTIALILIGGGVIIGLAGVAHMLRTRGATGWRPSAIAVLVAVLAVATPVGAILYSLVRESVWGARNIISSWPAMAVCLGAIVSCGRVPLRLAATGLVVIGFAIGGVMMIASSAHRPDYAGAVSYVNHIDPRGGPVADFPGPSPGPLNETEAALDLAGAARVHPVFRIGTPPLSRVLAAPPYALLRAPAGETTARQAAAAAGTGPLFLILPSGVSVAELNAIRQRHVHSTATSLGYLGTFLGALPARFQFVAARTFTGIVPVSVYVLRG